MAETAILTLTDFLLARIAEDEEVAREVRNGEYLDHTRDSSALRAGRRDSLYATVFASSGRILAECEAKRKMVFLAEATAEGPPVNVDAWTAMKMALRFLALPYADHPDYREEEWRP